MRSKALSLPTTNTSVDKHPLFLQFSEEKEEGPPGEIQILDVLAAFAHSAFVSTLPRREGRLIFFTPL